MTKLILMAAIAAFVRIFTRPALAAQGKGGGFNFLPALSAVCIVAIMTACGGSAFAETGEKRLHEAVKKGEVAEVKRLLDGGANINAKDAGGKTPLEIATIFQQTEVVRVLVKAGADIDAKNSIGYTALHLAAGTGQTEIARILIKAGADVYALTNDGKSPYNIALTNRGKDSEIALILQRAMEKQGATAPQDTDKGHPPIKPPFGLDWGMTQEEIAKAGLKVGHGIDKDESDSWVHPFRPTDSALKGASCFAKIHDQYGLIRMNCLIKIKANHAFDKFKAALDLKYGHTHLSDEGYDKFALWEKDGYRISLSYDYVRSDTFISYHSPMWDSARSEALLDNTEGL